MVTQPTPKAPTSLRIMRIRLVFLALLLALALPAADAAAQGRRARLSSDLEARLQRGDDADVTVIVTGNQTSVDAIADRHGLTVQKRLSSGAVLKIPAGSLAAVASDPGLDNLSSNQILRSSMAVTNAAIGADQAWESIGALPGVTGKGVGVAVIDSGIANVPALRDRVLAALDFTDDHGRGLDHNGHGTHVAGIIAAAGTGQNADLRGVAPGAHLVSLKVLDEHGRGTADTVIEAIDWVVDNHDRYGIRVINMSLGGAVLQSWRDDPICQAVARAFTAGITVVASAGNFGTTDDGTPLLGGITVPGNCPHSITVGALNTKGTPFRSDDVVATYSSKGPTLYDRLIKPDLVAPGNKIQGLAAPGTELTRQYPELVTTGGLHGQLQLSGTSMAAAAVSGAVALLLSDRALTPQLVRIALQYGAELTSGAPLVQWGAGSLNVLTSLTIARSGPGPIDVLIAGDSVRSSALVFGSTVVWGDAATVVWGEAKNTVVWGDAATVVWGDAATVVWGDAATVVWGEAKNTVVWGDAATVVWGDAATVVWGDAATVVWGEAKNTVVWGDAATAVWGDATVVWGE